MLCPWSSSKALNYMTQRSENVLSFSRPSAPDCGATALNLVHQAAEIFSSIENHARETEARAQSLCESAVERLKGAECARLEIINEADCKLQEAAIALKKAQSRIVAAEDKLTAVEFVRKLRSWKRVKPSKLSHLLRKPS